MSAAIERSRPDSEQAVTPSPTSATQQPVQTVEASPLNLQTHPLLHEFIDYG